MKTKIGRGLLALLVCVQALAAPNAYAWARNDRLVSLPRLPRGRRVAGGAARQEPEAGSRAGHRRGHCEHENGTEPFHGVW